MGRPGILLAGEPAFVVADQPSLLSLHNPELMLTTSGREAFLLVLKHRPRLAIVSDVLPDMEADDLFALLRADRELRHMSLLLLSSREGAEQGRANAVMEIPSMSLQALAERADRLLSVTQRVATRASVCLDRRQLALPETTYAETVNLSESGLLLDTRESLEVGEEVWLRFALPRRSRQIRAQGQVVRQELAHPSMLARKPLGNGLYARPTPSRRFGLAFTTLLPQDQLDIRQLVSAAA